ncbi:MAG: hypothetical protein V3U29_05230, partial [Phycisphaeraceae bacterium]
MRSVPRLIVASIIALTGCAPERTADPLAVMLDRDSDYARRRRAAEQARLELGNDPARIDTLNRIVWDNGYPAWQRCDAIDELVEIDEVAFIHTAARRIVDVDDWPTLEHLFARAVEHKWTAFTPIAVRNYARLAHDIADEKRPERAVIEQLNPGKHVQQVVFEVFENADNRFSFDQQVAAWELFNRLVGAAETAALLGRAA